MESIYNFVRAKEEQFALNLLFFTECFPFL